MLGLGQCIAGGPEGLDRIGRSGRSLDRGAKLGRARLPAPADLAVSGGRCDRASASRSKAVGKCHVGGSGRALHFVDARVAAAAWSGSLASGCNPASCLSSCSLAATRSFTAVAGAPPSALRRRTRARRQPAGRGPSTGIDPRFVQIGISRDAGSFGPLPSMKVPAANCGQRAHRAPAGQHRLARILVPFVRGSLAAIAAGGRFPSRLRLAPARGSSGGASPHPPRLRLRPRLGGSFAFLFLLSRPRFPRRRA